MIVRQVGKSQVEAGKLYLVRRMADVFISRAKILDAKRSSISKWDGQIYFDDVRAHTVTSVMIDNVSEIYEIIL